MRKKELIKRIEMLEHQVSKIKNPDLLSEVERRAEMQDRRQFVYEQTEYLRKQVDELADVVRLWKDVFYTSGIVTNCEANRTEYQWQPIPEDKLHRNPHFRINKVAIEKELK